MTIESVIIAVSRRVAASGPDAPWPWTDDTEMACHLVRELREHGDVDQDRLAARFAADYEPYRGYGSGTVVPLHQIRDGVPWRRAAAAAFDGQGSMGNGAAMRVAPLGAFHAGDHRRAALQAMAPAEITHAHPEAVLGRWPSQSPPPRPAGPVWPAFDPSRARSSTSS